MIKRLLLLVGLLLPPAAFAGPMINGNQINPASNITIASVTVTNAVGANNVTAAGTAAGTYDVDSSSGLRVQAGTTLIAGPAQFTYTSAAVLFSTSTRLLAGGSYAPFFSATTGFFGPGWGLTGISTAGVSGIWPTAQGGTGLASPTAHDIMIGNGASPFTVLSLGSGNLLIGAGASADPASILPTCGTSMSCTISAAALSWNTIQGIRTIDSPTFAGLTLSAALTVPNGGTGQSTLTSHGVLTGAGSGAVVALPEMGAGGLVIGGGSGIVPSTGTLTAGTGISISNANGGITITNTAPAANSVFTSSAIFTANGTYNTSSTAFIINVCCAGGGGGGGGGYNSSNNAGGGGGAASTPYCYTGPISTGTAITVTIGGGGSGGATGTNGVDGNAGTATTFGTLINAVGGNGGKGAAASTGGNGGAGGVSGGGGGAGSGAGSSSGNGGACSAGASASESGGGTGGTGGAWGTGTFVWGGSCGTAGAGASNQNAGGGGGAGMWMKNFMASPNGGAGGASDTTNGGNATGLGAGGGGGASRGNGGNGTAGWCVVTQ